MRKTKSFWSACESLPGLVAVESEWRQRAGADYDLWKPFLRPRQELASSIPCKGEHSCGCYHQVIDHGNGKIVAACCCEPPGCDSFAVTTADLAIYELHVGRLGDIIAKAMSFRAMVSEVSGVRKTRLIGIDSPTKGYEFPVYLTCQYDPGDFHKVVFALTATSNNPFILISPTNTWHRAGCRTLMDSMKSLFLTIPDILRPTGDGKFIANPVGAGLVGGFHERILPGSGKASVKAFFETPINATWGDVNISFSNRDTVAIRVKVQHGIFSFVEMGMADGRTGNPNKQWELLYAFAQGRGVLDWEHPDANKRNKKRKEMLSQSLRDFFRIDDEPFTYDKDSKGWITRFYVEPD
ncbi:MAG: hypothetical protein ACYC4F_01500 [Armatimonadota bacterium]